MAALQSDCELAGHLRAQLSALTAAVAERASDLAARDAEVAALRAALAMRPSDSSPPGAGTANVAARNAEVAALRAALAAMRSAHMPLPDAASGKGPNLGFWEGSAATARTERGDLLQAGGEEEAALVLALAGAREQRVRHAAASRAGWG